MILLDLFSGTGGFAKGLQDAGFEFEEHYFSEIDKHCIANYLYNFKNSKYIGDVTTIHKQSIKRPDIITFGSPCQDFSLAGKRTGLEGQRSSLIRYAIDLIDEFKPSIFIWENVKGVFSSNSGEDFWAIIKEFANLGCYELEWQLINTKWLLPQNRERIYLIGHLTRRSRPKVFPITENDCLPFQRQKDKPQTQYSGTITNNGLNRSTDTYVNVARCITGGGNSGGLHSDATYIKQINKNFDFGNQPKQQNRVYDDSGIISCLSASRTDSKVNVRVNKKEDIVCHNTQPRSGDPKKGGTGHLSKLNESYCIDTSNSNAIEIDKMMIRRLTEIECERLQGYSDDWTRYGIFKNLILPIAKTHRYKMIGNAVTAKMVELIGRKLLAQ